MQTGVNLGHEKKKPCGTMPFSGPLRKAVTTCRRQEPAVPSRTHKTAGEGRVLSAGGLLEPTAPLSCWLGHGGGTSAPQAGKRTASRSSRLASPRTVPLTPSLPSQHAAPQPRDSSSPGRAIASSVLHAARPGNAAVSLPAGRLSPELSGRATPGEDGGPQYWAGESRRDRRSGKAFRSFQK